MAKYLVYFVSGFMFIPAGRDVVAPGTAVMPDDDKLLDAMFSDKSKPGWTFMWNAWGVNWIMLSIMKIMAVKSGNADFIKLGFAADAAAVLMMIKGWLPEFAPFLAMVRRLLHCWRLCLVAAPAARVSPQRRRLPC